ncbi:hypothetical protein QTP86_020160, partial [Hemibagrus guttatus]
CVITPISCWCLYKLHLQYAGRYVNVIIPNVIQYLTLCEVEVYGVPVPVFKRAFQRIKFNSSEDLSNPTLRDKVLQKVCHCENVHSVVRINGAKNHSIR